MDVRQREKKKLLKCYFCESLHMIGYSLQKQKQGPLPVEMDPEIWQNFA